MWTLVRWLRWALLIAMAIGGYLGVQWIRSEQALLARENEAIEQYNAQQFTEAAEAMEAILAEESSETSERSVRVRALLAKIYANWAEVDVGLSFEETLRLYRRARALDPDTPVPAMLERAPARPPAGQP